MAAPKSKQVWRPRPKVRVSKHDHVGYMIFTADSAGCRECGQMWDIGEYNWIPVPYTGRY